MDIAGRRLYNLTVPGHVNKRHYPDESRFGIANSVGWSSCSAIAPARKTRAIGMEMQRIHGIVVEYNLRKYSLN
jgi:hypothetical protein